MSPQASGAGSHGADDSGGAHVWSLAVAGNDKSKSIATCVARRVRSSINPLPAMTQRYIARIDCVPPALAQPTDRTGEFMRISLAAAAVLATLSLAPALAHEAGEG